jgi:glycosyltransferase involved in cell wall biosynthesis
MDMRVGNVIEEGRFGGPQRRIAEVAAQLREKNVDTTVIFPTSNGETFQKKLVELGVEHVRLPLHHLTKRMGALLKFLLFMGYEVGLLYRLFKRERFAIIHCSGGAWQYKGLLAGKLSGAKTLWHLNDTRMPRLLQKTFRYFAKRYADGFIVSGQRVKEFYLETFGLDDKPIFEIQAPVNTSIYDPQKTPAEPPFANQKETKIVTICNISPTKGLEYFIQMAYKLNKIHSNLVFFIVGRVFDSQRRYWKKLEALKRRLDLDNAVFYGPCDDSRIVLKAADIYVCSSIFEASPMSVWEAMSMEKAIVSTDVGDVSRFIHSGDNGFIVPTEDAQSLADKVHTLLEDTNLRRAFGKKARMTAVRHLDIQVAGEKHFQAYCSILERR